MKATSPDHTAVEVPEHRRLSPIGTEQRHYRLSRALRIAERPVTEVVVVPSDSDTFIYPADDNGDIADYWDPAAERATTDPDVALLRRGYSRALAPAS